MGKFHVHFLVNQSIEECCDSIQLLILRFRTVARANKILQVVGLTTAAYVS
jgi:hypothetical protein